MNFMSFFEEIMGQSHHASDGIAIGLMMGGDKNGFGLSQ
jgi:hypothetical protein